MKNPESVSANVFNAVIISSYLRWTVAITPVASFNSFRSPLTRECVPLVVDFNAKRYSTRSRIDNRDRQRVWTQTQRTMSSTRMDGSCKVTILRRKVTIRIPGMIQYRGVAGGMFGSRIKCPACLQDPFGAQALIQLINQCGEMFSRQQYRCVFKERCLIMTQSGGLSCLKMHGGYRV